MQQKDWIIVALGIFVLYLLTKPAVAVDARELPPAEAQIGSEGSPSQYAVDGVDNISPSIIVPMRDDQYGDILSRGMLN